MPGPDRPYDRDPRDGEQSVGVALTPEEKVEIGLALERLGIDVVEAGFPAVSPGERAGVCAAAGALRGRSEAAAQAFAPARRSRIHIVLATSACQTGIPARAAQRHGTSRLVSRLTGYPMPPHEAILGAQLTPT